MVRNRDVTVYELFERTEEILDWYRELMDATDEQLAIIGVVSGYPNAATLRAAVNCNISAFISFVQIFIRIKAHAERHHHDFDSIPKDHEQYEDHYNMFVRQLHAWSECSVPPKIAKLIDIHSDKMAGLDKI